MDGAFFPHSTHELSIFEPRYRKLYNDILVSGSRRFVVINVHPDDGRLAEVGAVFYLQDLREVSEQSRGKVKYVCDHRVIGRARIGRVLNPSAWEDRSTYLRAETMPVEDEEDAPGASLDMEAELMERLRGLTQQQQRLDAVEIDADLDQHVNASQAEEGGLWALSGMWCEYLEHLGQERMDQLRFEVESAIFGDSPESDEQLQFDVERRIFGDGNGADAQVGEREKQKTLRALQDRVAQLEAEIKEADGAYMEGQLHLAQLERQLRQVEAEMAQIKRGIWDDPEGFGEFVIDDDEDQWDDALKGMGDDSDEDEEGDYGFDGEYYSDDDDDDLGEFLKEAPPYLQAELTTLRSQCTEEARELQLQQVELAQQLLQSSSHRQRLVLLGRAVSAEIKRLSTRHSLEALMREKAAARRRAAPTARPDDA